MLSCHHVIVLYPQGNDMVKERDADLKPKAVQRKFFCVGVGKLGDFPKGLLGEQKIQV